MDLACPRYQGPGALRGLSPGDLCLQAGPFTHRCAAYLEESRGRLGAVINSFARAIPIQPWETVWIFTRGLCSLGLAFAVGTDSPSDSCNGGLELLAQVQTLLFPEIHIHHILMGPEDILDHIPYITHNNIY